jgi:hypothetical protein
LLINYNRPINPEESQKVNNQDLEIEILNPPIQTRQYNKSTFPPRLDSGPVPRKSN